MGFPLQEDWGGLPFPSPMTLIGMPLIENIIQEEGLGRNDKFGFQHDEVVPVLMYLQDTGEEENSVWSLRKRLKLECNFQSHQHVWVRLYRKEKENIKKRGSKKRV